MKQRFHSIAIRHLLTVFLPIVLFFSMSISVQAQNTTVGHSSSSPLLIADYAGMLNEEEIFSLSQQAQHISTVYRCQPSVVFVRGLNGYASITDFTEDFFLQNGYGLGADLDGIMLMIDVLGREYWITTSGTGIDAFTDAGQLYIKDQFVPYLSRGNWADAAKTFLKECDRFLQQAQNGTPYDVDNLPRTWFNPFAAAITAVIGLLTGALPLGKAKKEMKNVHLQEDAEAYIIGSRPVLNMREDKFLGSHIARTPIPRDTGGHRTGSGGGSSVHTHSSGHSFGGSGGKF
ncbi:MAG: TPM domain-containing protein [Anaerolineaceae bacterium]|nr:TPM domain-containing protein [Anaerolineaceae bacterium]